MNEIKVSIVVPCYNVANYIECCLNSIINQTLKDIEIICVNDGSTDNTLDILKKYASKDSRIKIIDKPNSGYGNSMNQGFAQANGEYIGIVESDDFVELNMYELLYNQAKQSNAEIVKSDYYRYFKSGNSEINELHKLLSNHKDYKKVLNPRKNFDLFNCEMMNWTGIYKNDFIRTNNIKHNETPGASFQDNGFWFLAFATATRICFLNEAFYHYRCDNPNSSINNKQKVFCMCDEYQYIHDELKKRNLFNLFSPIYFYKKYHNYLYTLSRIGEDYKLAFLQKFSNEYKQSINDNIMDYSCFPPNDVDYINRIIKDPNKFLDELKNNSYHVEHRYAKKIRTILWYVRHKGIKYTIRKVNNRLLKYINRNKTIFEVGNVYAASSKNHIKRLKSSSGGMFYEMAKYTLKKRGVVFGAAFNTNWEVDMCYIKKKKDIAKLMTSKYAQANIKNVYQEAQHFLENNKMVLFTGTPCQIHGLRKFLNKNYEKLICVEIVCHGVMPKKMWLDYLKVLKKPNCDIKKINFRDKTNGWQNYNFRVDYSDGTSFIQNFKENIYMRAFLSDQYLLPSCYSCKFKNNNSIADITIGDYWGIDINHKYLNDSIGTSTVFIRTSKGINFIKKIKNAVYTQIDIKSASSYNGGWNNIITTKPQVYNEKMLLPLKKAGIITLSLHKNIGGILQCFALQTVLENFGLNAYVNQIPIVELPPPLPFADKYLHYRIVPLKPHAYSYFNYQEYDLFVIGSDQIWRKEWMPDFCGTFLDFANDWCVSRLTYAPSFGVDNWQFNESETSFMRTQLSKFDAISVRENNARDLCEKHLQITPKVVVDPTLLFDMNFYSKLCEKVEKQFGFFVYILDKNDKTTNFIDRISKEKNAAPFNIHENIVEEWLAAFRDAKFVITDSYHGCLFSLLFNKPFICLYNNYRGGSRFDTLIENYDIKNRVFDDLDKIDLGLLDIKPDKIGKIEQLRKESVAFLEGVINKKNITFNQTPDINKNALFLKAKKEQHKEIVRKTLPYNSIRGKIARFPWKIIKKIKKD